MAKKTFKIGEYCRGGIITIETDKKNINIIGKDWDHSQGTMRGSDQSNAKEWTRLVVPIENPNAAREMSQFLNDLTTSYYTDQIMKWIESKVKLERNLFW